MEISEYTTEAVRLLKELIATPSVSRDEAKAADIIEKTIREYGLEARRLANNVWTIDPDYDEAKPTVLLNAHIDTVKPVSTWTRDPFSPDIEDGILYGLGSNDCGGGLCSLLQVFRIMTDRRTPPIDERTPPVDERTPPIDGRTPSAGRRNPFNLVYLASAEEEVSGKNGVSLVLPHLPHIDVAIVGEPTGMQPAIAEKGLMVIDMTAHGKSGHAARNEGVNAIYEALPDIEWVRDYRFERVSKYLGPVKMTLTVINAGTQHNVVPDECRMLIDVRPNELYTNLEVFDIIRRHVRSEVNAHSFRLQPSHIDINHPIVEKCLAMGMKPYGSPTLSDQALMPFPSLKLGPGESSRSHSADEFIRLGEIDDAIEKYVALLDGLKL